MGIENARNCESRRKVTLGVCVRNCEGYIKEAIESIIAQSYPHDLLVLVFVDGGSEDKTLSIIRELASKIDIKCKVLHDFGRGLGYARNLVIANAEGDFVLWVDGDMILCRDFVAKLVAYMENNPEVGIAKGKQALDSGGNLASALEGYSRVMGHMVDYRSEKGRSKSLGTSGCIYRAEVFRDVGGFDERMRGYGEDQDIEIRVRAAGWSLDTVDAEYLDYERHGVSWKGLWSRYWLRGYYTHCFLHKHKRVVKHYRTFPPASFFSGLFQSSKLYKLTSRKKVFMLPFHYFFKMTAWYVGYIRGHVNSYEPDNRLFFPKN
jgi:alpha-1,3-rhamnosyltransferase